MNSGLFILAIALGLSGCNYEKAKPIEDPAAKTNSRFAVIQRNIFQPKCISCHSANIPSGGIDLSSYSAILRSNTIVPGKPLDSRLYASVESGRMPRASAPLSQADLNLIQQWILEGAVETEGQTPQVEPAVASFQWISKNIFQMKCVVCHNPAKPRGKVDLSSYGALLASPGNKTRPVILGEPEKSTLFIEIKEQKMPPSIKPLNPDEIRALQDWILAGAPAPSPTPVPSLTPGPTPTPGPPAPNYAWLSANVFSRRCGSCHGIPAKVANLDFTSYETLLNSTGKNGKPLVPSDPEHSTVYNEVLAGHMPPPRKTMTEDEIRVVNQWILEGAKNN